MRVLFERKSQVDGVVSENAFIRDPFRHTPCHRVEAPLASVGVGDAQLRVLLLQDFWRKHDAQVPCHKDWLAIADTKWLDPLDCVGQFGRDVGERKFRVSLEDGDEILGGKTLARVRVQALSQLRNPFTRKREAYRMRVPAKAGEEFMAAFKRGEEMKRGNRPA